MKNLEVKKLRHGVIKPRTLEILLLLVPENLSGMQWVSNLETVPSWQCHITRRRLTPCMRGTQLGL